MPAFVLDEKKICDNTKTILSSNSRRCTIQITFIYIPGYCDILKTEKMGKFLLAKLVQYSGVSKTRKKSCASYACVKVTCIFNKLNGEPSIVWLLVFLWKNSFVNTNSLQIYTQTCWDHFLSFVDSLYVQDEFTVDLKKCSNMTLVFYP